jgi:glycerol-3-phosphate dehydrogenase
VVLNAMDAKLRGANIRVRTELLTARRVSNHWEAEIADRLGGRRETIQARIMVNAAGPWVQQVLANRLGRNTSANVRLVKGSHIIVRRLFDHDHAYIFQNADERIIFAIPYEHDFTLIGTTDVEFTGDPADVSIDQSEIGYLCAAASEYLITPVLPSDVVWSYSGVRPLYDDGGASAQEVTRDFVLKLDTGRQQAPLLSVFGGKITTYRHLAEEALKKLRPWVGQAGAEWTRGATLPGGDFEPRGFDALLAALKSDYSDIQEALLRRLARLYGTRARQILAGCQTEAELGQRFGDTLYEREAAYLVEHEWARTADDILWRRTKLGLRFTADERGALEQWLGAHPVAMSANAA